MSNESLTSVKAVSLPSCSCFCCCCCCCRCCYCRCCWWCRCCCCCCCCCCRCCWSWSLPLALSLSLWLLSRLWWLWRCGGVAEWWSGGVVVAAVAVVAVVVVAAVAVVAARTITRMKVSQSVPTGSGLARPLIEARLPRLGVAQQCQSCSWTFSSGMGENMAVLRRDVCNRDVRDPCPYNGSASARLCHTHNHAGSWKMKR